MTATLHTLTFSAPSPAEQFERHQRAMLAAWQEWQQRADAPTKHQTQALCNGLLAALWLHRIEAAGLE